MQSTGQFASHTPQSMHASSSITYGVPSDIQSTGQFSLQVPHSIQVSKINLGIKISSLRIFFVYILTMISIFVNVKLKKL
jgi:hypothetical protein